MGIHYFTCFLSSPERISYWIDIFEIIWCFGFINYFLIKLKRCTGIFIFILAFILCELEGKNCCARFSLQIKKLLCGSLFKILTEGKKIQIVWIPTQNYFHLSNFSFKNNTPPLTEIFNKPIIICVITDHILSSFILPHHPHSKLTLVIKFFLFGGHNLLTERGVKMWRLWAGNISALKNKVLPINKARYHSESLSCLSEKWMLLHPWI